MTILSDSLLKNSKTKKLRLYKFRNVKYSEPEYLNIIMELIPKQQSKGITELKLREIKTKRTNTKLNGQATQTIF
jgi:hypothetical protein